MKSSQLLSLNIFEDSTARFFREKFSGLACGLVSMVDCEKFKFSSP